MSLLLPCAITVLIETALLAACYRRDALSLALYASVNAATNLALNLALPALSNVVDITYAIYPLEALVVAAEYAVYALALGRSRRLFWLTLAANVLSYGTGLILYGHV